MKTNLMKIGIVALGILPCSGNLIQADISFVTLDYDISQPTFLFGISGNTIVGRTGGGQPTVDGAIGISYNMLASSWSTYAVAGASSTQLLGVQNGVSIGSYKSATTGEWRALKLDNGVRTDLTGLNHPNGVDGPNIAGFTYTDGLGDGNGVLFNGTSYSTIPNFTSLNDIEGNVIIGRNLVGGIGVGAVYDGVNTSFYSAPGATIYTSFEGIDNGAIVGWFDDANVGKRQSFVFKDNQWTVFNVPGSASTTAYGIDGDRVVGYYNDMSGVTHGFIAFIPEPSTFTLAAVGLAGLIGWRRFKR